MRFGGDFAYEYEKRPAPRIDVINGSDLPLRRWVDEFRRRRGRPIWRALTASRRGPPGAAKREGGGAPLLKVLDDGGHVEFAVR